MTGVRGFVLQSTFRSVGGRAVPHLYGVLETGEAFLIRDTRYKPGFYLRTADLDRACVHLENAAIAPCGLATIDGFPVARLETDHPEQGRRLRERLHDHGVATFEADLAFATRYLLDHRLRGSLLIEGPGAPWSLARRRPTPGESGRWERPATWSRAPPGARRFDDPSLRPCSWAPRLRVLSLDIETDPRAREVLSIGLYGCGAAEVLLRVEPEAAARDLPAEAVPFPDEKALIEGLVDRIALLDPDVLTGWNVVDFDLAVLLRVARRHGVAFELGRGRGALRLRPIRQGWASQRASIPGRLVLDGLELLRGAFVSMEAWNLDFVARSVLGTGKTMTGSDRARDILDAYRHDRARFVAYNLNDAKLVLDILDRLQVVELAVERSLLTGLPLDRVAGSIAAFDFLYLGKLHERGLVAPTVRATQDQAEANLGGHVLEPAAGLHRDVLVFDFKSLYPSIIRTFQIDPLGYLADDGWPAADPASTDDVAAREASAEGPIVAPNGARFHREKGILTELLDELFPRREAAKAAGDRVASHAIKILMNSFYGVLGTPACRFYQPAVASAVTAFGRELLRWTQARFEARGHTVVYGDTDSLFVRPSRPLDDGWRAFARALGDEVQADLARHLATTWGTESRLELELEGRYRRLLLPSMRGGPGGARKRYAGLLDDGGEGEVRFVGMEAVRRDWTQLAKEVQQELYERFFRDRPVERFLAEVVRAVRAGERDEHLVYRKALRKPLEAYTATTPPHVAAARKLEGRVPRTIRYVMTKNGPEPIKRRSSPLDYEHYVQKQVRPVAEPILAVLGAEFDRVVGDDRQLTLF